MRRLFADPLWSALAFALAAVAVIYAATFRYGLVSYDDPWLVEGNWILARPSLQTLHTIWFDFDKTTRHVLGSEYLPVRDVSILVDRALWGDRYGGFHLTSVLLYAGSIVVWSRALLAWGLDRRVVAITVAVWAVLPVHVESVAWLSERKGVLAALFAGVAALGLGHFRGGRAAGWLVLGTLGGVLAVWSKAPAAFALAALAALELALPGRLSWRRSLVGLAVVGGAAALAFVPVLVVATSTNVVGDSEPAGLTAIALHGFYLQLAAMVWPNAVTYPIAELGPSAIDLAVGAVGLALALAVLVAPRRGRWQPSPTLRAACALWLVAWFPVSRLVLPLRTAFVADRYLLLPSLGLALAAAVGIAAIASPLVRRALLGAILVAGVARSLDARESWEHDTALWRRAAEANPHDGKAHGMYVGALLDDGDPAAARVALERGLAHVRAPDLLMRQAMFVERADPAAARRLLREAAMAGSGDAALRLAALLQSGDPGDALTWARRGSAALAMRAYAHRIHGAAARAAGALDEAAGAYARAYELEPRNPGGRCELGRLYDRLGRRAEAQPLLVGCKVP